MVTTGGAEGETQRKRKFVARTEGENQGGGKEGERKGKERTRETGCPFVVDLFRCRRGFPFLCVHASLFRYFAQLPAPENWKASRRSPLATFRPVIYIRDPLKIVNLAGWTFPR